MRCLRHHESRLRRSRRIARQSQSNREASVNDGSRFLFDCRDHDVQRRLHKRETAGQENGCNHGAQSATAQ